MSFLSVFLLLVDLSERRNERERRARRGKVAVTTYYKLNWSFLQQTLRMIGFSKKWCQWINQFVSKGSVGIKVNDDVGRYF